MTKIKNTKKGMAKKTLSMSLVVAMLATSNVPVWAAEFSDGSDVAVETEADAFVADEAETPVVEDTTEDVSAASVVESGDITTDLKISNKSVVWGTNVNATVTGTIAVKDNVSLGTVNYRWTDENGIVPTDVNGTVLTGLKGTLTIGTDGTINTLNLPVTKALAGKTLTLRIYSSDGDTNAKYDINTNISVTIEKQELSKNTTLALGADGTLTYNGFEQGVNVASNTTVSVTNKDTAIGALASDEYVLTSSTAKDAKKTVTVTATATDDSAYTGSISVTTDPIGERTYSNGDILTSVDDTLTYQYTGKAITIPTDKVTLKESKKELETDDKLGGADLHTAVKKAVVAKADATPSAANSGNVTVTLDTDKLTNFKGSVPGSLETIASTKTKVTIKQRDLTTAGTKIAMKYANVPTGTSVSDLVDKYLTFTAVEGGTLVLDKTNDYKVEVKDDKGNSVNTLENVGTYKVSVTAIAGGNCTGSQTFDITTAHSVINGAKCSNYDKYTPSYTGSEIKPSKDDLGTISITYSDGKTVTGIQPDQYEITGYTNNVNATVYQGTTNSNTVGSDTANKNNVKSQATVTIKLTGKSFNGETISVPFNILPLKVTADDIKVPSSITYNKGYTKAEEYKVPVTITAKDKNGKNAKTLDTKDFSVKYEFKNGASNNFNTEIVTKVTVTNTNYIYGSADATKSAEITATANTKITAKALTDSMVIANPSTYTYTGGKITPTYYVMDGQTVLYKEGEVASGITAEYKEVSIDNAVNVGTGTIKVKGIEDSVNKSGYSGEATGTFSITPANTSAVKVEFTNSNTECKYTGKQVRPRSIKVTLNGNVVTDQFEVVSYGENISGTGTVVLKPVDGNKNFTGDNVTAEFNIVKEEVKADLKVYDNKGLEISNPEFDYDGTAHTFTKILLANIKKTNNEKTSAKESDFEIKYVDNIAGKKSSSDDYNIGCVYAVAKDGTGFAGAETITTADGTIIKGVVAKKEFKIKNVKFVAKNVTIKNGVYAAGLPVKPEILIQIGGTTLVEGKDYKLTLIEKGNSNKEVTPTEVTADKVYGVKIEGINGYTGSNVTTSITATDGSEKLVWGVDKKNINDCTVTVKDGVVTVLNGYLPVASTEYTAKNNGDGTYTITANSTSKNYTGSKTVTADGKAADEKPNTPMISSVKVVGNKATAILSGEADGAAGYDYVISTDRDCITNKDYDSVNKNQVQTSTTFKYVQQGTYYAYCHAWKRDENGKKVFSDWSNAYPFVVSAITPDAPVITNVTVSGSTIKVTYKAAANATGYDVVLGTGSKKENGETRPYQYGNHKKLNLKEGTVTATFKNVPKGTWVVGMHAFNRTSEDGKKVFSPWSNLKKATVK